MTDSIDMNEMLVNASSRNQVNQVQACFGQGADLRYRFSMALRCGSEFGHVEVVQYLLAQNNHCYASGEKDEMLLDWCLYVAVKNDHFPVVQCLLDYGANIEVGIKEAKEHHQALILKKLEEIRYVRNEVEILSKESPETFSRTKLRL